MEVILSVETDIAEIKSDIKHIREALESGDKKFQDHEDRIEKCQTCLILLMGDASKGVEGIVPKVLRLEKSENSRTGAERIIQVIGMAVISLLVALGVKYA